MGKKQGWLFNAFVQFLMKWQEKIIQLPEGYSKVRYKKELYGLTKTLFNNGKSIKIYAESLGGNDLVSLNYYQTSEKGILKPCEMSRIKVVDFLENIED